jgi:hypothetical protein
MFKSKFRLFVILLYIGISGFGPVFASTDPSQANWREAMANLGEIEKAQMLMERSIAQQRPRLIEEQQKARTEASARGLLHLSAAFWSAYENSTLLRDVFDAHYKIGRGRHFAEAFLLAFEKRYQRQCAAQDPSALTLNARVEVPNIDWQIDRAGRVLSIRQGEPVTLSLALPEALSASFEAFITTRISVHSAAALQQNLDTLNHIVSPNPAIKLKAKPNRILSPEQGLDWWGKAEVDAARWFHEVACESGEMQQLRRHLFAALGAPVSANGGSISASIQDDLTALQDKSPSDSVRRSCMNYYAYDVRRADWCGCIDLSLHRDILDAATDPAVARARYDGFRQDFRSLLELGNLDLLNPDTDLEALTQHPDWEYYRILTQCERKVL